MNPSIDPDSPVPLYHQIAEALRGMLAEGELGVGDALPTLREAAKAWGVNLHTIRHAYTELAREGLVESRASAGTRVIRCRVGDGPDPRLGAYLDGVIAAARQRFGLSPSELVDALRRHEAAPRGTPRVAVVECSRAQCQDLAEQLQAEYEVQAEPWPLSTEGEPPALPLVATYFHYNEIRRRWPRRLAEVAFTSIRPAAEVLDSIPTRGARTTIRVCERDEATAATMIADLSALEGAERFRLEPTIGPDPASALSDRGRAPVLFSPRTWAQLDEAQRADPRARHLRYVFDPAELREVAARFSLNRLSTAPPRPRRVLAR